MESVTGYIIARPNGWDIYTGATVNYRKNIGKIVKWSEVNMHKEIFIKKVNFASANPNDCWFTDHWVYAYANGFITSWQKPTKYPFPTLSRSCDVSIPTINCSAYRVEGVPVCEEKRKWGFEELKVVQEIKDLDSLFGWKYSEANNPINPLKHRVKVKQEDIELLRSWAYVYGSVLDSLDASDKSLFGQFATRLVFSRVGDRIEKVVGRAVCGVILEPLTALPVDELYPMGTDFRSLVADPATIRVWNAVYPQWLWDKASPSERLKNPVYDSVEALCYAYVGSLFPNIKNKKWKNIKHKSGEYPFQPAADLWRKGLLPSFDGSIWRLHSGKEAQIVYEEQIHKR